MGNNLEQQRLDILNELSEEEKSLAFSILDELKNNNTNNYNNLKYSDWNEIPVDIDTFIDNETYMGNAWTGKNGKSKLFPAWRETAHKLFPDNITTAVNNLLESGARGLGKSEFGCAVVMPYLMYRVLCLKDPAEYYDIKDTESIVFAFMNITKDAAEKIAIEKFQKNIQLSPWFMSRGAMTQFKNKPFWVPPAPIRLVIGSQSSDVIGQPIFGAFFDELSFIRNLDIDKQKEKATDMVNTALGGMSTRFIKEGGKNPTMLVIASSKRSEQSFMETYIKSKFESEPDNIIVVDKPVWEIQPRENFSSDIFKVALGNKYLESQIINDDTTDDFWIEKGYRILEVPVTFKSKFKDNLDRALCDYAGISSTELSKYISGSIVNECLNKQRKNPLPDILEIGDAVDDTRQYYNFFDLSCIPPELKYKPLFIHLDMSLGKDMTGIAGIWIQGKKPSKGLEQSKDLFYSLAFSTSIKAPKGRRVSFEKNRNFIRWLREQGFAIKKITADTYQSYDLLQILSTEGFDTEILSVDRVDSQSLTCLPYQTFKNTLYEHRLELYYSKRLVEEITDLERNVNTGKVDHPPNGHKDVSDASCGALFIASKYADQYAYDYGEHYEIINELNLSDTDNEIDNLFEENFQKGNAGRPILTKEDYARIGLTAPIENNSDGNDWYTVLGG